MVETQKYKVFIIDDHPIVVNGLTEIINKSQNLSVCGHSLNAIEALKLIENSRPDIVTVDLSLKDMSGIELIKEISQKFPYTKILVISMYDEDIYAIRCFKAGAKGYIMKEKLISDLMNAMETIIAGKTYFSESIKEKLIQEKISGKESTNIVDILSDRELEIFELIGEGLTTEDIAEKLEISIKTVETYKSKIKDKLGLKNFTQLIKAAVEYNLSQKK